MLSTELYWLCLTLLFTSIMWLPYIFNRMREMGLWNALYNPQPDTRAEALWARRMMSAHNNAVENLIIFAPLVLLVELTNAHSDLTHNCVVLYFYSRLVHFIVFSFGIPLLRIPAFLAGFLAQVLLALSLLGMV